MDVQWKRMLTLAKGLKPKKLSMSHDEYNDPVEDQRSWNELDFSKTFPCETVQEFCYTTDRTTESDQALWNTLLKCTQLKVLEFHIDHFCCDCDFKISMESDLAKCRLDVCALTFHYYDDELYDADDGMLALLSKARIIHWKSLLTSVDIGHILATSQNTLEELELEQEAKDAYDEEDFEFDEEQQLGGSEQGADQTSMGDLTQERYVSSEIVMTKLASYTGYLPRLLTIKAPLLKTLTLQAIDRKNTRLLQLWGSSIEHFACLYDDTGYRSSYSYYSDDDMDYDRSSSIHKTTSSLIHLTACHTLTYNIGSMSSPEDLLSSLKSLSRLRHLTLIGGYKPTLTAQTLYNFLHARKNAGEPIESLALDGFDDFSVNSIRVLQRCVPRFTYRTQHSFSSGQSWSSLENFKLCFPPCPQQPSEGLPRVRTGPAHKIVHGG
jgi:hypothetical protein